MKRSRYDRWLFLGFAFGNLCSVDLLPLLPLSFTFNKEYIGTQFLLRLFFPSFRDQMIQIEVLLQARKIYRFICYH
jgi:hypothetical protein